MRVILFEKQLKEQEISEREMKYNHKIFQNDKIKQKMDRERSVERQLKSLQETQKSEQVRYVII